MAARRPEDAMLDGMAQQWRALGQTVGVREQDLVQLHLAGTSRADGLPALVAVADDRCRRLIVHVDRLAEHVRVPEVEAIARHHGRPFRTDGARVVVGIADPATAGSLLAAVLERHATSPQLVTSAWLLDRHARAASVAVNAFTVFWPEPDEYAVPAGPGTDGGCQLATAIYGHLGAVAFLDGGCWISRRAGRARWVIVSTRRFGPIALGCDDADRVLFAPTRELPNRPGGVLERLRADGHPLPPVGDWPGAGEVLAAQLPAAGYHPRHVSMTVGGAAPAHTLLDASLR